MKKMSKKNILIIVGVLLLVSISIVNTSIKIKTNQQLDYAYMNIDSIKDERSEIHEALYDWIIRDSVKSHVEKQLRYMKMDTEYVDELYDSGSNNVKNKIDKYVKKTTLYDNWISYYNDIRENYFLWGDIDECAKKLVQNAEKER